MAQQIFDQERPRPRSTMAQRLDEAFAGCDEWTVVAAPPRRSQLEAELRAPRPTRVFDGVAALAAEDPREL